MEEDEGCFDLLSRSVGRSGKAVARSDAAAGDCSGQKPRRLFRGQANRYESAHAMAVSTQFFSIDFRQASQNIEAFGRSFHVLFASPIVIALRATGVQFRPWAAGMRVVGRNADQTPLHHFPRLAEAERRS